MPRRPRLFLPNQPQHVVVRGHNRDPILARHEDFRFLYKCLLDAVRRNALAVHAWVFMHNHLHLLATPPDADSLPRTMQSVGRRYAQYFNRTYHRSGALWEGRYKASLVDTERYLMACYRYIEMNPVRAGIARRPEDYPYSSYHANALGREDALVRPHEVYLALVRGSGRGRGRCQGETTGQESALVVGDAPEQKLAATPTPGGESAAGGRGQSRTRPEAVASQSNTVVDEATESHLAATPTPETAAYRQLFDTALTRQELTTIRRGTEKGLGIGQAEFLLRVAKLLGG